jgi:hypothetical protein
MELCIFSKFYLYPNIQMDMLRYKWFQVKNIHFGMKYINFDWYILNMVIRKECIDSL